MLCIISLQKALNSFLYREWVRQLTFPDHANPPLVSPQTCNVAKVATTIPAEFRQPETKFGFWKPRKCATRVGVAVPKAAVHKDDLSLLGENDIWLSRKVGNVEPEFVSAGPGYFPHQKFRFCVFAANERHPLAALGPRERIHFPLRAILFFADGTPHQADVQQSPLWKSYTFRSVSSKLNYSLFHRPGFISSK
jgi:hypothetical protein